MNKVTTSQRIKEIMKERNLKQKDILGLTEPYCKKYDIKLTKTDLSQYVSEKTEPGQYKLMILSLALNVNLVWLMGYDVSKELNRITIRDHCGLSDEILYAIDILLREIGYKLDIFSNSYQLEYNDTIVKLSPKQIMEYKDEILKQIDFVTKGVYTNRLRSNIYPVREDHILNAAHEIPGSSEDDKQFDNDIMNDENF